MKSKNILKLKWHKQLISETIDTLLNLYPLTILTLSILYLELLINIKNLHNQSKLSIGYVSSVPLAFIIDLQMNLFALLVIHRNITAFTKELQNSNEELANSAK